MSFNSKTNPKIDALIFDVDGVLIDVTQSYRQTIIETVDLFFAQGLGLSYGGSAETLLSLDDVDELKQAGGFNNDWNLTIAFINYFLELIPPQSAITMPIRQNIPTLMTYLSILGRKIPTTMHELRQRKNIRRLARGVADLGGGLPGLRKLLKRNNRHMLPAKGSLLKSNIVERIFQEVYLGETLFEQIYQTHALTVHGPGLIHNETLLMNPEILTALSQRFPLSIATGRPAAEATYSLERLKIAHLFNGMVSHDDLLAASQPGKPDPWSLLEAAQRLTPPPTYCAYIGDTVDDILAAKAAGQRMPFIAIGSLAVSSDKQSLRGAFEANQADLILDHPDQLQTLFLSNSG